ncbi:MAG: VCBS repeat-containing protein, partial [Planctomycetia bacterium]|nr:VCBS repeat-containing protein [Planctomycetia bacterium]
QDDGLSLYVLQPDGTFRREAGPLVSGTLPVRLAAADLNGDGLDDLIVACAGSSNILIYYQTAAGAFSAKPQFSVGVGVNPTMIQTMDVNGDGRRDVVVANQASGDVSVLLNTAAGFAPTDLRFRAGVGLYGLGTFNGAPVVRSLEGTSSLASGDFTDDGRVDLIVGNAGANSLALLRGDGRGGFLNPTAADTVLLASEPLLVVAGRFNGDAHLDLAVLTAAQTVEIYAGDGQGGFTLVSTVAASNLPTGLTTADVDRDGKLDLLVGNKFGDVLVLRGRGDGQFEPYRRAGQAVTLAVTDINGDGLVDFVLADAALDRVVVQYSRPGEPPLVQRDGLLAPGAVAVADLNRDGLADLIVSNSGGNNLLVYLGIGQGQFAPALSYFTGTNPAGLTVHDLDGDGWLDIVVANRGSNDVSVLLGRGQQNAAGQTVSWKLEYGPRLNAGFDAEQSRQIGLGPVATAIADVDGDGVLDLLVSNSGSNNVSLIRGVGSGFFLDLQPRVFAVGNAPGAIVVGQFDARIGLDLVVLNTGSNTLTFLSDLKGATQRRDLASGGLGPIAALGGDFNNDGFDDLVVAHNGNGLFALLFGSASGPELARVLADARLDHPTDIALAARRTGSIEIFASGEGHDGIFRLTFDLHFSPLVADLLPLRATELTLVATLVAGLAADEGAGQLDEAEATGEESALPALQPFVIGLDNLPRDERGALGYAATSAGYQHWFDNFERVWQGTAWLLAASVFDFLPTLAAEGIVCLDSLDAVLGPTARVLGDLYAEAAAPLTDAVQSLWRSGLQTIPARSHGAGASVPPADAPAAPADDDEGDPAPAAFLDAWPPNAEHAALVALALLAAGGTSSSANEREPRRRPPPARPM